MMPRTAKVRIPIYPPTNGIWGECPWIIVKQQSEDRVTGIIENDLIFTDRHGFQRGDDVEAVLVDGIWQVVSWPPR